MTACKSNLKNIGTALEMYSSDNGGRFPSTLEVLTPRYLKALPSCPAAASVSYAYVSTHEPDNYTIVCAGEYHKEVAQHANYPQYTSTQGLLER